MISDIIIIVILVVLLGGAIGYMRKEKKKGVTCIGCPDADICAKRRAGKACQSEEIER